MAYCSSCWEMGVVESVCVLLILPDSHMHTLGVGRWRRSMREAPLTLATLAALGPEELDIEWRLVDGTVEEVDVEAECDLVGISLMTGTAAEGYRLADQFRKRGVPVVLGGVHVGLCESEAAAHADAIVVGMAERTWPELLRDFARGEMKPVYRETDEQACIEAIPTPRYDLIPRSRYNIPSVVMTSRGCRRQCSFCSVPPIWGGHYRRSIDDVMRDVAAAPGKVLGFNDVDFCHDREGTLELLSALTSAKRWWGGLATMSVADDPEMLEALARSGCKYLLVGMESLSAGSLREIRKGFNRVDQYRKQLDAFHAAGISIQACIIFGFDDDDRDVFARTVDHVAELKIDIPRYSILTPYPGTALAERLEAEGRILSRNWDDYDTMHVVFEPAQMTAAELYEGFKWAYRRTFTMGHVFKRLMGWHSRGVVNMAGNLTYRRFVKRLYNEPRFAAANSVMQGAD